MSGLARQGHHLKMLSIEATQVVWLRTMRLAGGGPAALLEATHILTEKALMSAQTAWRLSQGKTPLGMAVAYRREVRANLRRLSKPTLAGEA